MPTLIAIVYDLYRLTEGDLLPVTDEADVALQDEIRKKDSVNAVTQEAYPNDQADVVDEHVTTVVPAQIDEENEILFALREDSKYDPEGDAWVEFTIGASVTYPLNLPRNEAKLFLAVKTVDVA